MPLPFVCEVCRYSRDLAEDYAGTRFACPQCDAVQDLPPATAPADPAPGRACPFCAEPVRPEARKCRWCGEILDRALAIAKKKEAARDLERRRELILREAPGARGATIVGLVGLLMGPVFAPLGFALGPSAILMAVSALRAIAREPRLEGRGLAKAGLALGITTIAASVVMLATNFHLFGNLPDSD